MRRSVARLLALLAVVVLVAGCSSNGDDTSTGEASTTTATTTTSAPTTTAPPTTTTPASTTSTSETVDADVWDLVYISDSSGWGVAAEYAARIEADLGVEVEVHDLWGGGLPALVILEALRGEHALPSWLGGSVDDVRPVIAEAEVIVVYGNPEGSETPEHP
jgi:ABC-type transport system substrate-binding protein